jgi:hypothetical protein
LANPSRVPDCSISFFFSSPFIQPRKVRNTAAAAETDFAQQQQQRLVICCCCPLKMTFAHDLLTAAAAAADRFLKENPFSASVLTTYDRHKQSCRDAHTGKKKLCSSCLLLYALAAAAGYSIRSRGGGGVMYFVRQKSATNAIIFPIRSTMQGWQQSQLPQQQRCNSSRFFFCLK